MIGVSVTLDKVATAAAGRLLRDKARRLGRIAVREETREVEHDLEEITRATVPGRLWRAWKSNYYDSDGVGIIFVNGGERTRLAMRYFSRSGRVQAEDGGALAIPTDAAGVRRSDKRLLTPEEWERRNGRKLRYVPARRGRPPMLVLDEGVLSGRRQIARPNTPRRAAAGRGNATIPIFIILRGSDHQARYSIEQTIAPAGQRLSRRFIGLASAS